MHFSSFDPIEPFPTSKLVITGTANHESYWPNVRATSADEQGNIDLANSSCDKTAPSTTR